MRFKIEKLFHLNSVGVWLFNDDGESLKVAKQIELEFTHHPDGYILPEPTLEIKERDASEILRSLGEELLLSGFLTADSKELEATKKHLEDMQKLTFDMINKL